ncbi:MAG: carbon starvation protein A [Proteobacteria bacterium]|jgi:carbon starvation protein CstA|nr:carbon starvation protein A [Pseudomonadota bacterium]
MTLFVAGLILLVAGYFFYGGLVARSVAPDPGRPTPAIACADGVDYVAMPTWRVFLIQLLNIAGLGPVFGPILGAMWGPQVFLWVVLGSILGGAVHDMLAGAVSVRNNGAGLPEIIGRHLGPLARHATTLFILVLMVLVGTVFVKGPAGLIVQILPAETVGGWLGPGAVEALGAQYQGSSLWMWIVMGFIFTYYVFATMLPIDKLIGRVYPFLGACLLVMVVGLLGGIVFGRIQLPELTLANLHPDGVATWPIIFITVSCGAISGFHATQSPLMARCLKSERRMHLVFYGAMITEALIALVWSAAASGYYGGVDGLVEALGPGRNPALVVNEVCVGTMGVVGGVLAVLGVIVLPITSGDTAFRAGRLIAADYLKLPQRRIANRYKIALPMFAISLVLSFVPFGLIWRYFGWANQTLAAVTLWACAVYLARRGRLWWIAALPASFMTVMTVTYILVESRKNGCLGLDHTLGTGIGLAVGLSVLVAFIASAGRLRRQGELPPLPPPNAGGDDPPRPPISGLL